MTSIYRERRSFSAECQVACRLWFLISWLRFALRAVPRLLRALPFVVRTLSELASRGEIKEAMMCLGRPALARAREFLLVAAYILLPALVLACCYTNKHGHMMVYATMTTRFFVFLLLGVCSAGHLLMAADGPPVWAYGTSPEAAAAAPPKGAPDTSIKHLADSQGAFTKAQIGDRFAPADWYPGDHPVMPEIISHGRKPEVWACGLCHYPNGKGRPENAGVAGYSAPYFIEQMRKFREGERSSADKRKNNTNVMIAIAKAMTDDEIKAAADYYAAMKWTPWIKVVETKTAPKTYTNVGMYLPLEGNEKEAIGERIIETPVDAEETEGLRNPRSGFIAYAPIGSVKKGEALVTGNHGKSVACGVCHGSDLKGLGPVPGLAGRSPSYLVRQMYDMQQGTRHGNWTELMKPAVNGLSSEDLLNIAAYLASRTP